LLHFDWDFFKAKQVALNVGVLAADIRLANSTKDVNDLIRSMVKKRKAPPIQSRVKER